MQTILPALRPLLFALATVSLVTIAGCGLKGDLVLPEPDASNSPVESESGESEDQDGDDGRQEARP